MVEYIPSLEEKKKLKKEVSGFLKKFKGLKDVKFTLGGSYAKDTWLPGNKDVDVFAKFNYSKFKDKDISLKLYSILKKKFKNILVIHGSRDYYQQIIDKIIVNFNKISDINFTFNNINNIDQFKILNASCKLI